MEKKCPICKFDIELYRKSSGRIYHKCASCGAVFLDESCFLQHEQEKARYENHNNDVNDFGYRDFVLPVVAAITKRYTPCHSGLDFGCGTGPVASVMLGEKGYKTALYDPFFYNDTAALKEKYDYVICCEVAEHFKEPLKEFMLLKSLLKPGGSLFCMTELINEKKVFEKWSYKNDPTHVIFYTLKSMEVIADLAGFGVMESGGRLIIFS